MILPGHIDLGAALNVVVRFSKTIPEYGLETVRIPRFPNSRLPSKNDVRNQSRSYSCKYMGSANGVDINTVLWIDNKLVRLASTYKLPATVSSSL